MKRNRLFLIISCVVWVVLSHQLPAAALDIVLTNDDGFESLNIQTLFDALKAAGHDVIMSAPLRNQSGKSGSVSALTPITPLLARSEGGNIRAGSPGVGPTTIADDQYYVNGTPVAAVLYGIDVLAPEKWGRIPDLVICGPNNGHNLGLMTVYSGTIGAAVTAINKGIPAIVVSSYNATIKPTPQEAELYARLTVKLVQALMGQMGPLLPRGIGLNVNLPIPQGGKAADAYEFSFTKIGLASNYGLKFYNRLGDSPFGADNLPKMFWRFPGVAGEAPSTAAGYPEDNDEESEYNALQNGRVTISLMEGTYQAERIDLVGRLRHKLSR